MKTVFYIWRTFTEICKIYEKLNRALFDFLSCFKIPYKCSLECKQKFEVYYSTFRSVPTKMNLYLMFVYCNEATIIVKYLKKEYYDLYQVIKKIYEKNKHILEKLIYFKLFENINEFKNITSSCEIACDTKKTKYTLYIYPTADAVKRAEITIEDKLGYECITYRFSYYVFNTSEYLDLDYIHVGTEHLGSYDFRKGEIRGENKKAIELFLEGLPIEKADYTDKHIARIYDCMVNISKAITSVVFLVFCLRDLVNEFYKHPEKYLSIIEYII